MTYSGLETYLASRMHVDSLITDTVSAVFTADSQLQGGGGHTPLLVPLGVRIGPQRASGEPGRGVWERSGAAQYEDGGDALAQGINDYYNARGGEKSGSRQPIRS